jgi:hypothetical protein
VGEQEDARRGDRSEGRNRSPRRSGGEHELEERDRIVQSLLERPERAVSVVRADQRALADERNNGDPQPPVAATRERTPPDVHYGRKEPDRYRGVEDPEGSCCRRQVGRGHD